MINLDKLEQSSTPETPEYYTNAAGTSLNTRIEGAKSSQDVPRIQEDGKAEVTFNISGSFSTSISFERVYKTVPLIEATVILFDDTYWKLPMRDSDGSVALIEKVTTSGFTVTASTNPIALPYPNTKASIVYRVWNLDA